MKFSEAGLLKEALAGANLTDNHEDGYHKVIGVNDTQFLASRKCHTEKTKKTEEAEIQFFICGSCEILYNFLLLSLLGNLHVMV